MLSPVVDHICPGVVEAICVRTLHGNALQGDAVTRCADAGRLLRALPARARAATAIAAPGSRGRPYTPADSASPGMCRTPAASPGSFLKLAFLQSADPSPAILASPIALPPSPRAAFYARGEHRARVLSMQDKFVHSPKYRRSIWGATESATPPESTPPIYKTLRSLTNLYRVPHKPMLEWASTPFERSSQ